MADTVFDASSVGAAKGRPGGYAWVAPLGTELPVDVTKTMNTFTAFESLGYISEDGITNATDTDTKDRKDWSGDTIKTDVTSYSESYSVTFLESRDSVLKTVYGDGNVTTDSTGVTHVKHNKNFTTGHVFVFENVLGDGKICRSIIKNGSIAERDDVTKNSSDLLGYTPTIKALADENSDTIHDYMFDPKAATESTPEA